MTQYPYESSNGTTRLPSGRTRQNGDQPDGHASGDDRWQPNTHRPSPRRSGAPIVAEQTPSWSRFLQANGVLILLITVAVTFAAWVASGFQTRVYTSQAVVLVVPASSSLSTSQQSVFMGTEKGIASSDAVISIASRGASLPAHTLRAGVAVTVPTDTDLLEISFTDPKAAVAQKGAQELADAYVKYRVLTSTPPPSAANAKTVTPTPPDAVQASIITSAPLPASPSSPNVWLDLAAALVLGLGLGVGVAFVRDSLDDRLRGVADLQHQAHAPVLGRIPSARTYWNGAEQGLVMVESPRSGPAEAYRELRTRLIQMTSRNGGKAALVTSCDREGRSTVAANLAVALAQSGRRVILVCADIRKGRAHELFGLDNEIGLTTVSSRNGKTNLARSLRSTGVEGLRLLSAGPPVSDPTALLQSAALPRLLPQLCLQADFVIVDGPPVLSGVDAALIADYCSLVVLVADAHHSTRSSVRTAVEQLGRFSDDRMLGCVLRGAGSPRWLSASTANAAQAPVADWTWASLAAEREAATPATNGFHNAEDVECRSSRRSAPEEHQVSQKGTSR